MTERTLVSVSVTELERWLEAIVATSGADQVVSEEVARHLVRAQRSGHASHGVLRLPQYFREIADGLLDPTATAEVTLRNGSACVVDGHLSFGQYAGALATATVIEAASVHGVGVATIRNSTHVGRLGEYTERIAEEGMIGLMVVGAAGPGVGGMKPFGGHADEPYLNTNPWCVCVPADPGPVLFDGSMTTIAEGKVHASQAKGEMLPPDAIIDRNGAPSNNPADYYAGGSLLPLGGAVAGHKGYGLALTAALLGGLATADGSPAILHGIAPVRHEDGASESLGGVTILAIDPGLLGDRAQYRASVSQTVAAIRETGAMVPGDMEYKNRQRSLDHVDIAEATFSDMNSLAESVGVLPLV